MGDNNINVQSSGNLELSLTNYGAADSSNTNTVKEISIDEGINSIPLGRYHLLLFFTTIVSFMSFAFQSLLLSSTGSSFGCSLDLTPTQLASVSTVFFVGGLVSTVPFGQILDRLGRKPICLYIAISLLFYGCLYTIVQSFYWSLIIRFLCGIFAIGINSSYLILVAESIHYKWRLLVIGIRAVMFGITSFTMSGIAVGILSSYDTNIGWRITSAIVLIPTLLTVFSCLFIVESPRFYMAKKDTVSAKRSLQKIAERNGTIISNFIIKDYDHVTEVPKSSVGDLVKNGMYRITIPLMVMWFSTGFTYFGMVNSAEYLISINDMEDVQTTVSSQLPIGNGACHVTEQSCDVPDKDELISVLITSTGDLLSSIAALAFIYFLGRSRAYACTMLLCFIFLIIAAIGVERFDLTFVVLVIRGFASSSSAANFLYTLEIYPTKIRGTALFVGEMCSSVACALAPLFAQDYLPNNTVVALVIFAVIAFFSGCCSLLLAGDRKENLKDT